MKKFLLIIFVLTFSIFSCAVSFAANTPVYDATFNNNAGGFFANGTPITITEGGTPDTIIVSWNNGSNTEEIPSSSYIFGGGTGGSSYDSSSVTLESGTAAYIYGGGFSTDSNNIAVVGTSNVIINGGNVVNTLYGGGLLYTTVISSNVTVNEGTVNAVLGGGGASATVDGVSYSTGTEENPENSQTRVNTANLTMNGGIITTSAWGGGQGYSYTGSTDVVINGGDLSNAYLTAGGSNGYTGNATVTINGGTINVYQSTNRGTVESVDTTVNGGTINEFFVGGEDASDVTGTLGNGNIDILNGNIGTLSSGTSGALPLDFSSNEYNVVVVPNVVDNSTIPEENTTTVTYTLDIIDNEISLKVGTTKQINYVITTEPSGYESLFNTDNIVWESDNTNIVTVDENGVITGVSEGTANVTATLFNSADTTSVTVTDTSILTTILWILLWGLIIFILALAIIRSA